MRRTLKTAVDSDPLLQALVEAARRRRDLADMLTAEEAEFVSDEMPAAEPLRLAAADPSLLRTWSAAGVRLSWEPGFWNLIEGGDGLVLVTGAIRTALAPGQRVVGPADAPVGPLLVQDTRSGWITLQPDEP